MASNYDIAHAWAHNQGTHHGNGGFRHEYNNLYSYSTVIGQRLQVNGNVIFLVNTYGYSHTTFKHQGFMQGAIPKNDDNVYVFYDPEYSDYSGMISTWRMESDSDAWRKELVRYGLKMLAREYQNCKAVETLTSMNFNFSRKGFNEMCRWFKVTNCITLPKLLKMSAESIKAEYSFYIKNYDIPDYKRFKAFLKAMADNQPLERIIDMVCGKEMWQAYLDRTAGLRLAKKNRELSQWLFFLTPQNRYMSYYGDLHPVVKGSVTSKDIQKHTKSGDLIPWLLSLKKRNYAEAVKDYEFRQKRDRIQKAKLRLEHCIGLSGFELRYNPFSNERSRLFSSFDYDGTVIRFSGLYGYKERALIGDEYKAFREMTKEQQQSFIHEKRLWMLDRLQADQREYEEQNARMEEERRRWEEERRERERVLAAQHDHIEALKAQGDTGYRQLYHECLPISLPYGNASVFYGGNVLLRYNTKNNLVETSKSIKLSVDEAKRLWVFVSRLHETGGANAKGMKIHCVNCDYTVHSYENDILTAGCHQIAYPEMAYVAKQLHLV